MMRRLHHDDRGATSADYVGILTLVCAIVAAIFLVATPVAHQLTCAISGAISSARRCRRRL